MSQSQARHALVPFAQFKKRKKNLRNQIVESITYSTTIFLLKRKRF